MRLGAPAALEGIVEAEDADRRRRVRVAAGSSGSPAGSTRTSPSRARRLDRRAARVALAGRETAWERSLPPIEIRIQSAPAGERLDVRPLDQVAHLVRLGAVDAEVRDLRGSRASCSSSKTSRGVAAPALVSGASRERVAEHEQKPSSRARSRQSAPRRASAGRRRAAGRRRRAGPARSPPRRGASPPPPPPPAAARARTATRCEPGTSCRSYDVGRAFARGAPACERFRSVADTVLSAEHLTKSFGDRVAVSDVSFDVAAGEVFGFLGPNGAGKTTTIRMLVGLARPDRGPRAHPRLRRGPRLHAGDGARRMHRRVAGPLSVSDRAREPPPLRTHAPERGHRTDFEPRRARGARRSGSTTRSRPTRSGCASASGSHRPCSAPRTSSSSTSPPTGSTRRESARSGGSCASSPRSGASPSSSRATSSRRSSRCATGSRSSTAGGPFRRGRSRSFCRARAPATASSRRPADKAAVVLAAVFPGEFEREGEEALLLPASAAPAIPEIVRALVDRWRRGPRRRAAGVDPGGLLPGSDGRRDGVRKN